MTTRERRLAKAERLREWAEKRDGKAAAARTGVDAIASRIPFGQPILVGHHSERRARRDQARIESGMRAQIDNARTADGFRSRADNIDAAVGRAIYDDDPDVLERLREKIAALEAKREQIKAENAAFRAAHRAELKALNGYERDCAMPHAGYVLRNLGGTLSQARKRLKRLEANGGKPADKILAARRDDTCVACGGGIDAGDRIRWNRVDGARHVDCGGGGGGASTDADGADGGVSGVGGGDALPPDAGAYTVTLDDGRERRFLGVGARYTATDRRAKVLAGIDALTWQEIPPKGEALSVGFMPGEGINAAIRELRLPKVSAIAIGSLEFHDDVEGEYPGLYGIEAHYANGRVRVYLLDEGTQLVPAVADHWPEARDDA